MPKGIYDHTNIIPWNKGLKGFRLGVKHTEEAKDKIRLSHLGKKRSDYTKNKISDTLKGHTAWNKGKKGIYSIDTLEKMRLARIKRVYPKQDTSIEIAIQNLLDQNGLEYIKHKRLLNKYQVDIFIEPKWVIEVDGDYWHNLPIMKVKDGFRDYRLTEAGYRVLRLREWDINNNLDLCRKKIINLITDSPFPINSNLDLWQTAKQADQKDNQKLVVG